MTVVIEIASWACILLGSFFALVGALGLVRMPDVFTRMHAAGVTDTAGVGLLILGMAQAVRNPRLRPLAGACVLMVALLCIPERKWGNHAYVAFPLLGALAGVAAGSLLERVKPQAMAVTLAMASVVAWAGSISGIWAQVLKPPCVFSTTLAPALDGLKPDDPILVVSPEVETLAIVELAAERKLPADGTIHSAVIRDGIAVPQPWMTIAKSGGWSFASDRH